jgi:hemoglobin-like flavoprotein
MSTPLSPADKRQLRQQIAAGQTAEQFLISLSAEVRQRIHATWERALAAPGAFAADLYANLFALAPAAANLFPGDMSAQQLRLTKTLTDAITLLSKPQELLLLLKASGVRHIHYQATFAHFPVLGTALDSTFQQRLGATFTADERTAWQEFYVAMATVMCAAMASATLERA